VSPPAGDNADRAPSLFLPPALRKELGLPGAGPVWDIATLAPVAPSHGIVQVEARCPPRPPVRQPFPLPATDVPDRWVQLHFQLRGVEVPADWPRDATRELGIRAADGTHRVWLAREQAWRAGAPLYAERTNYADGRRTLIVAGWEHGWRSNDPADAERAVRLLLGLAEARARAGRPRDFATPYDAETALTAVVQAIRRARLEPTPQRVAEYLDADPIREKHIRAGQMVRCDAGQVGRYLHLFWPGTWEEWVAQLPPAR
jgi:hypothetical protein